MLEAIARVNVGHAFGYGHDEYTSGSSERWPHAFGPDARAFFVFNGTGANVLSLRAACRPWEAVICAETAHLNVDEGGAPEAVAGVKLLTVAGRRRQADPGGRRAAGSAAIGDEHAVQPRVVSISQCTELGTLYSPTRSRALAELAHERGLLLARRRRAARQRGRGARSVAARGRATAASTCSRSAGPRTGCSAPRRSSS